MSNNQGFISLHRKLMSNPIWSDPNYLKLWIYCLFEASHKDRDQLIGNEVVSLKRGQFITGRNVLSDEMNRGVKPKQRLNDRTWFRYVKNLETWGMLTIKSTNKYSVITIDNYEVYQNVFNKPVHEIDQQLSSKSPTDDQQLSTNNNVNNVNNYINTTTTTTREEISDAIVFYQENFGSITPHVSNDLLVWLEDLSDELVIEAMKRAVERNKKNWGYVKSILQSWLRKNIRTIEQVKAEEIEFQNQQRARFGNNNFNQKPEIKPDWFEKRKQQPQQPQQEKVDEQAQAEMEALLSKYKAK